MAIRADVSYGVLEEESCSGHHSRRQGEDLQFQPLAGENIERMGRQKVAKVVTGCPHCFHSIRREYPTLTEDFSVEAVHHSELLVKLIEQGTTRAPEPTARSPFTTPATWGAMRRCSSPPGERSPSFCCGGGNAGFISRREEKHRVDLERKREIAESGADVLVTACPECKMMLDAAVEETVDLGELVAGSLRTAADG